MNQWEGMVDSVVIVDLGEIDNKSSNSNNNSSDLEGIPPVTNLVHSLLHKLRKIMIPTSANEKWLVIIHNNKTKTNITTL